MAPTLRILNVEPEGYSPAAREVLAAIARVDDDALDRQGLIRQIGDYDALITRLAHRIDREVLTAAPRLRAVASATTGLDHIDLDEAKRRDIAIVCLRGETEFLRSIPATAELTWGLLLSLTRRIPAAIEDVRKGNWNRDTHIGVDLAGRTLGIVGCGRIGERVARYGLAFGMHILAFDPQRAALPEGVERSPALVHLAAHSDVVSVHVPLGPDTICLVGAEAFAAMRQGSYFINTSRGGAVDERALLQAIGSGCLAGVALDVVSHEELLLAHRAHATVSELRASPRVIITPHIGGASHDSMRATEVFIARKLAAELQGCRT